MHPERTKALKSLFFSTPEAKAYWRGVGIQRAPGTFLPDVEPEPVCPTCGGMGCISYAVPADDPRFGKLFPCSNPDCPTVTRQRAERYARISTLAQIPKEYQWLTFDAWTELGQYVGALDGKLDALGAALAFVAAKEQDFWFTLDDAARVVRLPLPDERSRAKCSLVFSGRQGMGKTSLAVCIAQALIPQNVQVVYMRLAEFLDGLKDRFRDKPSYQFMPTVAGDDAALLSFLQRTPVLIIDEFYADATDWRKERAEQLVNYRYTHQLPTIITTNLTDTQLLAIWGETTGSRIQAMAHWFNLTGLELRPREPMVESR